MKNKNRIFYGWKIVACSILVTSTVVPLVMSLANVYLLPITQEMGISRSAFTLTSTITQGIGIFFSPFISKRLAQGNLKLIQTVGLIGFSLSYASLSLARSTWHFYVIAIFLGLFFLSATLIPISIMITNWFDKKRGLAMSLAMTGIGVGGFLLSPFLTFLLEQTGWRTAYQLTALILLFVTVPVSFLVFRKRPEDMGLKPYGYEEETLDEKEKNTDSQASVTLQLFNQPLFWLLMIGMFGNGLINSGSLGQFPPALEEMHGPIIKSTIISLYSLVGIFGKLILGWINDRYGTVKSTIFGCSTFAISFLFLLGGNQLSFVYLMAFFFGLGTPIGTVSPSLITSEIYGTKNYAEVYGIINSVLQVGLTVGSLAVAKIYDQTGSYQFAWQLLFVLTILTMISWLGAIQLSKKKYRILITDNE